MQPGRQDTTMNDLTQAQPIEAAHSAESVLSVQNLVKVYGEPGHGATHTALDGFSLQVPAGGFVGVMGPSGSGKTTLLNIMATIDRPTSGSVRLAGVDPSTMENGELALFRRRRLGFVFQDFNLLDSLSLRENILLPLVLDRVPVRRMQQRLAQITETLGISAILDRRPFEVSGGQQQRAAIARSIIHEPDLILADELTGNLDSKAGHDVMTALSDLNREHGVTVVMVTHDPFAASFCNRITFIRDGKTWGELHQSANRQAFMQQILDNLSLMSGGGHELRAAGA